MADDKHDAKQQPTEAPKPPPEPRRNPPPREHLAPAGDPDNPLICRGID